MRRNSILLAIVALLAAGALFVGWRMFSGGSAQKQDASKPVVVVKKIATNDVDAQKSRS